MRKRFVRVVMETQENHGVYYTGNKLFAMANGKYIYTIASDDVAKPDAIEKLHAFLAEIRIMFWLSAIMNHQRQFGTRLLGQGSENRSGKRSPLQNVR